MKYLRYLFLIAVGLLLLQFGGIALLSSFVEPVTTESKKDTNSVFLLQTKKAVVEKLKEDSNVANDVDVAAIVFNSERHSVIGGQQQVRLTFNYKLGDSSTSNGKNTGEGKGTIVLAKDENQNWFYSYLKLKQ